MWLTFNDSDWIVVAPWHSHYHIHKATEESIRMKRSPEAIAEITDKFSDYYGALQFFLKYCNIDYDDTDFPEISSGTFLFDINQYGGSQ